LAHDFALRGVRVTLVERGELTSGTTGRHHGLLHSGGRYAANDRDSASECIEENRMLRRICPGTFELNDGLFVAVAEEDLDYLEPFLEGCAACGIPTQSPTPAHALRLEPNLNPELKAAVRIPDGTIDAMRLALRFFATAHHNGADIRSYTEVTELPIQGGLVSGAVVHDHVTGRSDDSTRISWSTRRAMVGEDRGDGGCRRADPPIPGRPARPPRPVLQHRHQPPSQGQGMVTSSCRSGACPRSERAHGWWTIPTTSRCRRTTSSGCTPKVPS
jgi:FAD dependent oxidoreductase